MSSIRMIGFGELSRNRKTNYGWEVVVHSVNPSTQEVESILGVGCGSGNPRHTERKAWAICYVLTAR